MSSDAAPAMNDGSRWLVVALATTAVILAYGNAINLLPDHRRDDVKIWANIAVTAVAILFAVAAGLRRRELGLEPRRLRSAVWGLLIGIAIATPIVLYVLIAPTFTGEPVGADDAASQSGRELAWRALVRIPIGTAVPEEVLFRSLLFALWYRVGGLRAAVTATAVAFGLWHVVISFDTVSNSGIDNAALVGLAYAATLIGLTVGGAVFALLRWRTESIAAPVVLHWTINSLGIIAVWLRA